MTYVSKKEKVFDLPEQEDASLISLKNTDTRLKRFPSVSDRRAWTTEEQQRYQHLYGLVNGSETNIAKSSSSFKYIPFDVLLGILMAEKDAYIQELLERQDRDSCSGGKLYKAEGFDDSDDDRDALIRKDAEMVALKNKIAGLESELDDYRDTLTKAMHKLENMDAIMCENSLLREKIKYSEETIKCLEEQKQNIENELWNAKRYSESESEIVDKNGRWSKNENWERGDWEEELSRLASERDILKSQVDELQKELENAKTNAAEMEVLRKISETTSNSLEEITKENKCYKKKLETMKCLEKHVEDLKMQAQTLTDKYKRESQKANDQLKQINMSAKEVQALREERDRLQKRIEELVPYESQYVSLQSKLHQVEIILEENELLNKKLIQLDKLELENEHLKMKIEHLQGAEMQAVADKEKILQLQCEVVEQEEEIRRMLRQIEELSEGYTDKNEVYNLRKELDEKNGKLKQFERQVIEIPVLESEIEELKNKLQKCIDDFKTDKDLLKRLQEELEACRNRCQELEEMALPYPSANSSTEENPKNSYASPKLVDFDTGMNEREVENNISMKDAECQSVVKEYVNDSVQVKVHGECGGCGFEPFEDLQQLKERNETLKTEVEILRSKLSEINLDDFLQQTNKMKELLRVKEERIIHLESEITRLKDELRHFDVMEIEKLRENREEMEHEIKNLSEINGKLMVEIEMRQAIINRSRELEIVLMVERKAKAFAMNLVADLERELAEEKRKREVESTLSKLQKEEANMAKQGIYQNLSLEINGLKVFKKLSQKVIHELKAENEILRELKDHSEKIEITALKNLTKKLRAKVKALQSLSKPEIQSEYESVQEKVKMLLKETDTLVSEINNLKAALDSEKKTKDYLEKELMGLQAEIAACLTAGSRVFDKELAARDVLVSELKKELTKVRDDLEGALKEARVLRAENAKLSDSCTDLKAEKKILKNEIEQLMVQIEEQKNLESDIDRLSEQIEKQKKMENELDKFTASLSRREEVEKAETCKVEEHKNSEEEIRRLSALRDSLERQVIDKENKERELLSEIILLKNNAVELKSIISKFEAAEDELKKNLTRKDEELNEVMEANLYLKKEIDKRDLKEELWRRTGEKLEETNLSLRKKTEVDESRALSAAVDKIERELEKFKGKFSDCQRMKDEMTDLRLKRDSIIDKLIFFEVEMKQVKEKLNEFEKFNLESEEMEAEKKISDLASLAELEEKRKEIEILKLENENLHNELSKAENVLEVSRKLHKTASQIQTLPPSAEFFTPPALPSPRSSDNLESERETDEMMSVETHRKVLTDLENHFKQEIQKLKEANSKKVKKLSGNHEKDTKSRMKTFYENINNIKSNYENGIRKLVEKHKLSIGKLQELHEEEIEELHKNYETQMLAMEKQNDDLVNELKAKSAEKSKKMTEDHNRELEQIQTKYESILKEKEAQVQRFGRGTNEKDEAHKATLDNLTQFYQTSILELEEKHNKELKNCKKNHIKKIELMKNKYEDLLVEERKKYEEQLEEMLHRLKKAGQQRVVGTNEEVINRNFIERRSLPANPRLEFLEVLQKIINEGLESLTFEELILVHSTTCFVPETMNDHDERGGGELNESSADGCKHRQLMAAEKEELLKRIFTLEREIVIKQLETHEAIVNMEAAEKFRIQELKNALCNAQQKNMELKKHLSNQSKFEMDMKIEKYMMDRQASLNETNVMEKVKELERERAERKRIEEELQRERANVKNLTAVLESEKERFRSQRKRDSDYVESIRLRLEEALNHEQMMESQLDNEARFRAKLESELQSLQKSFNLIADGAPVTLVDSKTVKDFKNFDQCENAKKISKHNRSRSRQKGAGKALHNF